MNDKRLRALLEGVRDGDFGIDDALARLQDLPYEELGYAKLDHHRALRQGFPEVVFCPGKTGDQILAILERLVVKSDRVMASRADAQIAARVQKHFPQSHYYEAARIVLVGPPPEPAATDSFVAVLTGGTADIPVAEEAAVTSEIMGSRVERMYDVGVAGLHRLLDQRPLLVQARVKVVVAGMEGALASVVAGLVTGPVIAVPTSIGYGASFGGLAALLTMLNSCAPGVAVVNIDNGFGAGYLAHLIDCLGASK
jgi:NCAIR mutase (PurE)-related protein